MKKFLLLGVFALSLGVTLFISSAPVEANNKAAGVNYEACSSFGKSLGYPSYFWPDGTAYRPCPLNAQYFFEYDQYQRKWVMLKCPGELLFFCSEKRVCTYLDDPDCSWGDIYWPRPNL